VNFLEVVQKVVDTFWKRVYGESGFIFFDSILFGFIMSSSDSLGCILLEKITLLRNSNFTHLFGERIVGPD
jgi:hypothetical protein